MVFSFIKFLVNKRISQYPDYNNSLIKRIVVTALQMVFIILMLTSCTATRFIPKDKLLLNKNTVVIDGKPENFTISDLEYLIAQKPNKKFLGNRISLWYHYYSASRQRKRFWRWVYEHSGQDPEYVDYNQNTNTAQQFSRYSFNKGYFDNEVTSEVKESRNRLGTVIYHVKLGKPYRISAAETIISDTLLNTFVSSISAATLIKEGQLYDAYALDAERDRITNHLKNNGYFDFTKEFIVFDVDSSLQKHDLALKMIINNPLMKTETGFHKRFFIRDVNVFPRHDPFTQQKPVYDTVYHWRKRLSGPGESRIGFMAQGDLKIKPQIFNTIIQVEEDLPFSINSLRQTYKGLTNLKIYRASNITYEPVLLKAPGMMSDTNWLDCNIFLQRSKVNAYSVELEGTNSGGDLGIRGSLVFTNKNLFKGAEVLRLRLNGGFEAQRISNVNLEGIENSGIFNTTETGIDANLHFPRFVSPFRLRTFAKEYLPKTNILLGFSSQKRQLYSRTILKASFGYDWMTRPTRQHLLTPVSLSSVKVNPSPVFQEYLEELTNQRFKDQYSDHLILGSTYSYIYNNQNVNKLRDFIYYRLNIDAAGGLVSLFNSTPLLEETHDYHTFLGIRYAQYLRMDHDFRYYRVLTTEQRLVWRTMIGLGYSYGNSTEMPFERSYYAGGSNGLRGWQLRQLGPGSFTDSANINIERIGDLQLEMNLEYRFPVWSYLKGALFIDAGNIWTLRDQSYFKNGTFHFDTFYKEVAIDAGIGFRFDFSFFIFRLDAAVPLRNPSMQEDARWMFNKLELNQVVWNFGIGYPF